MARRCRSLVVLGLLVVGLMPSSSASAAETIYYSYDALGRLRVSTISGGPNNAVGVAACFDAAGNRTRYTVGAGVTSCGTAAPPPPPAPSNNPPIANPDSAGSMAKCAIKIVNVTANDSDPDGDALTVTSATASGDMYASVASASTVQIESGQTTGAKSIAYTISDGRGATASSTISVTVSGGVCN